MQIEEIALPKPASPKYLLSKRCSRKVESTGTGHFNVQKFRCSRVAKFNVDGVPLCAQHAGEAALWHMLKNSEAK